MLPLPRLPADSLWRLAAGSWKARIRSASDGTDGGVAANGFASRSSVPDDHGLPSPNDPAAGAGAGLGLVARGTGAGAAAAAAAGIGAATGAGGGADANCAAYDGVDGAATVGALNLGG